jgi:hypothetical protein
MFWEIAVTVIPLAIGAGALFLRAKFSAHGKAISAIEAGVLHAWESFGKDRKKELKKELDDVTHERDSLKFDEPDISKLKDLAKGKAVEVMASLAGGKDLASVLDPALWDLEIRKAVDRVKNK